MSAARAKITAAQLAFDFDGLDLVAPRVTADPVVTGSRSRVLWDVLRSAYRRLGFDAVDDRVFEALVLARIGGLTWDQGSEMARHTELTVATDMPVYFAHPRSPWERPSNENTNGLMEWSPEVGLRKAGSVFQGWSDVREERGERR